MSDDFSNIEGHTPRVPVPTLASCPNPPARSALRCISCYGFLWSSVDSARTKHAVNKHAKLQAPLPHIMKNYFIIIFKIPLLVVNEGWLNFIDTEVETLISNLTLVF